jgi:hypothetical protein
MIDVRGPQWPSSEPLQVLLPESTCLVAKKSLYAIIP